MRRLCQGARSGRALGVFDLQLVLLRLAPSLSMIPHDQLIVVIN